MSSPRRSALFRYKPAWHDGDTGVSGPTEKFFINPREFDNRMYSVCQWTMPGDRSF